MQQGLMLRWPTEALWQHVSPHWPGFSIEVVAEIDSTNAELMRRAREPQFPPTVLVAEHQRAGRGRLGRQWHSAPGEGLMMSVGLELRPTTWSGLSLMVGVVLAQTLDPHGTLGLGLKWPNDVWVMQAQGPRKLAGILIETALSTGHPTQPPNQGAVKPGRVVIGIGLNVRTPQVTSPNEGFRTPPIGLSELGDPRNAAQCLQALVPELMSALAEFERVGWAAWRSRYHARDVLRGQALSLSDGRQGQGLGVNAQGAFELATAHGVVAVHGDEISLRHSPGPYSPVQR